MCEYIKETWRAILVITLSRGEGGKVDDKWDVLTGDVSPLILGSLMVYIHYMIMIHTTLRKHKFYLLWSTHYLGKNILPPPPPPPSHEPPMPVSKGSLTTDIWYC